MPWLGGAKTLPTAAAARSPNAAVPTKPPLWKQRASNTYKLKWGERHSMQRMHARHAEHAMIWRRQLCVRQQAQLAPAGLSVTAVCRNAMAFVGVAHATGQSMHSGQQQLG